MNATRAFRRIFRGLIVPAVTLVISVSIVSAADDAQFKDLTRFEYLAGAEMYSVSPPRHPTGLTIVTVPSNQADNIKIIVSGHFASKNFDVQSIRVVAVTKQGEQIKPKFTSVAAGSGESSTLVTVASDFPIARNRIEWLIIQTKPARRDENDNVEALEVERPQDLFTRWGMTSDIDGKCEFAVDQTKMRIKVPSGSYDLAPGKPLNAPSALQRVSGDFKISVKVSSDFKPGKVSLGRGVPFNSGGLLVWANEENYLRLERDAYWIQEDLYCYPPLVEYWQNRKCLGFNPEPCLAADFFQNRSTWLKLARKSGSMTVSISHDGKVWDEIKTFDTDLPDDVLVGMAAINTSDEPLEVDFEEFSLEAARRVAPAIIPASSKK